MSATESRVPSWDEAALVRGSQGFPWWSAVLIALAMSATGVFIDLHRLDTLGRIFQVSYFAGCVLAVVLVQRKGLFGPMVQPPLILGVTVPGVVIMEGAPTSGGLAGRALDVGEPLINGFPTMALTTGVVLALGLYRLVTQRAPAEEIVKKPRATVEPEKPAPRSREGTRERLAERVAEVAKHAGVERREAPARTAAVPGRARGGSRTAAARAGTNGASNGAITPPDVTRTTPVQRPTPPGEPPRRRVQSPAVGRSAAVPPTPQRTGTTPPRVPGPQHRNDRGDQYRPEQYGPEPRRAEPHRPDPHRPDPHRSDPHRAEPRRNEHRDPQQREGRPEHQMTEQQRQAALRVTRTRRSSA